MRLQPFFVFLQALFLLQGLHAQGSDFNFRDPMNEYEVRQNYCIEVVKPNDKYESAIPHLEDLMVEQGLESEVRFFKNFVPECSNTSIRTFITHTTYEKIRTLLANAGFKIIGPAYAKILPGTNMDETKIFSEFERHFSEISKELVSLSPTKIQGRIDHLKELFLKKSVELGHWGPPLEEEANTYSELILILNQITPKGLDQLQAKHSEAGALNKVVNGLHKLWRKDGQLFGHTYQSMASVTLMAIKELEDNFPLSMVISAINSHFSSEGFKSLRRVKVHELSPNTFELLTYIKRYRPHLHPMVDLQISAIFSDAGFYTTKPPNLRILEAYANLAESVVMRRAVLGQYAVVPHVLFGDTSIIPSLVPVHRDIAYIEQWLKRHDAPLLKWQNIPGVAQDKLTEKEEKFRLKFIDYKSCDGFLTN